MAGASCSLLASSLATRVALQCACKPRGSYSACVNNTPARCVRPGHGMVVTIFGADRFLETDAIPTCILGPGS